MNRRSSIIAAGLLSAGCVILLGCGHGGGPPRTEIFGKVAFAGKPVEKGRIMFVPIKDTKGPRAGAEIVGGRYRVDFKGGVPIGTHRVEIMGFGTSSAPAKAMNGSLDDIQPLDQYIPAKYNTKSELQIEVSADGTREINFDLQ